MRGSKKHIRNWIEHPNFTRQLSQLLHPTGANIHPEDKWVPRGFGDYREARNLSHVLCELNWTTMVNYWWLKHGNATPRFDLASSCKIQGQKGLVIVEAKAHDKELELETKGKSLKCNASWKSVENHNRVGKVIEEASQDLAKVVPGVSISRDTHYQLSNRIAFSWKIASMGIPVVLVYLGFLGDEDMRDPVRKRKPLKDHADWQQAMQEHMKDIIPMGFTEQWIDCGKARMWMIIRSLPIGRIYNGKH